MDMITLHLKIVSRKHAWQYRNEPKPPWEQASWIRAVAFFAGEAGAGASEMVQRLPRQAPSDYRTREVGTVAQKVTHPTQGEPYHA